MYFSMLYLHVLSCASIKVREAISNAYKMLKSSLGMLVVDRRDCRIYGHQNAVAHERMYTYPDKP